MVGPPVQFLLHKPAPPDWLANIATTEHRHLLLNWP
jgi:hypothetical protein